MIQCHYEDQDMLILEKPAEMLSVPGRGEDKQDCLWSRAIEQWPDALIVHRLDCATSGLMVLARSKMTHRELSIQFQNRVPFKRYAALVSGEMAHVDGWVNQPLRCDWDRRPLQIIDHEQGKHALTFYRNRGLELHNGHACTRLSLYPITGRSHQLRVHCQYLGQPILGDNLYANREALTCSDRLMLHADLLELHHPISGERLSFSSPAPF
jgi:tRNA pseudouridine32 synthase/23S rRNA pseudouridine746 synthase